MMEEDFRVLAEYKEAQALKSKCHHQDHVERDNVYEGGSPFWVCPGNE